MVTTITCAFLPVMNRSLHSMIVKICTGCTMVFKLVWGLVLLCCKGKTVFFSGLILETWAFNLVIVGMWWSELMACLVSRKSRGITLFLSQKTAHIALPTEGCVLNFLFHGELTSPHLGLPFWPQLIVVTPQLITSNDAIQDTVTLRLILVQWVLTNLHTVFFLFLCEDTENFLVFQHFHHRF